MKWLRLWTEWGHDPKVQTMPEHMQRRHLMLLCLRRQCDTCTLSEEEIALYMRISMDDLQETKELFRRKKFIDNGWNVLQWDDRQFPSDRSTERVRKHREKLKKEESDVTETSPKRFSNGSSNAPEQIRTEQIRKEKDIYGQNFASFWSAYPKKAGKGYAHQCWQKIKPPKPTLKEILDSLEEHKNSLQWKRDHQYIPNPSTWLNQRRWEDEPLEGEGSWKKKYLTKD